MDIAYIIQLVLSIIGGASVLLKVVAPLTKTKKDDKVLAFLLKLLNSVAFNPAENKLEIKVK